MIVEIKGIGKITASKENLELLANLLELAKFYATEKEMFTAQKQSAQIEMGIKKALLDAGYYDEKYNF